MSAAVPRQLRAEPARPEASLPKADRERARALFRSADRAMGARRWAEAAGLLDDAIAIKDDAAARYNRGVCNAHLGKWVAAYDDYFVAATLAGAGDDADYKFIRAEAGRGLKDAAQHTALVAVVVRPVRPGERPTLTINGAPPPGARDPGLSEGRVTWGPLRLERGDYFVEVHADGRPSLHRGLSLAEPSDAVELVDLVWPEPKPAPSAPPLAVAARPVPLESAAPRRAPAAPWLGGAALAFAAGSLGLAAARLARGNEGQPYVVPALALGGAGLVAGGLALGLAGEF